MQLLKFKPNLSAGADGAAVRNARTSRASAGRRANSDGHPSYVAPSLADWMLTLQDFLGGMLSGIGVSILVGNILVCLALLLVGPTFLVEFLPV